MSKKLESIIDEVREEISKAIRKFPTWPDNAIMAAAVVAEEAGELVKHANEASWEPGKTTHEAVRKEAIQTAAMALRFLVSFEEYRFAGSEQHSQDISF